ncbi:MAG TPA: hypothetical protein VIC27_07505 [Ktedonobacterales bacterium]
MAEAPGDDKQATAPPATAADTPLDDAAPEVAPLDAVRRPLASSAWARRWRRQIVGALTLALVAIVAVGLFVRSTSDPAAAVASLLGIAPAEPALLPTSTVTPDNVFAAVHGVPWGVLTISGRRMAADETAGSYFQLAPGAHTVEYQAADFPTLRCVVSVPPSVADDCPLANAAAVSDAPQAYANERLLDLLATPARLLPDQRATLDTAISQALAAFGGATTTAPGELYLGASGNAQRADAPMRFSVTPVLASMSESQSHLDGLGHAPCGAVCASWVDPQTALTSASQTNWRLEVMVKPAHVVSDASGSPIITYSQSDARDIGSVALLAARTPTGWQVGLDTEASDVLQAAFCPPTLLQSLQSLPGGDNGAEGLFTVLPRNPADGCVIAVAQQGATPGAANSVALVIERFGVMQAANAQAARLFPSLPPADATAQTVATQAYQSAAPSSGAGG